MEEAALVSRLKEGDQGSFRYFVETRQSVVYNTAIGLLQHAGDAEDITQEVFLEVFRSIHAFKGESSLSTWVYRITLSKALALLRFRKRKKRFAVVQSLFGADNRLLNDPAHFDHPGVALENKEMARVLFNAIDRLPDNQKSAFTLHKVEGLSYLEIAEVMETSLSSVESLIHRARQNLRKYLADFYREMDA